MDREKEYFVSLLSSYLNSKPPKICNGVNWNEIYKLANIHNVTAIIANQISNLPQEHRPDKQLYSIFRQQLGYTLINYGDKTKAIEFIRNTLTKNNIDFMFIKGAVLSGLYPIKEFRTSGDIDAVIKQNDFDKLKSVFSAHNIKISETGDINELAFDYNDIHVEIHTTNGLDNDYFKNIFDISNNDGNEFLLSDTLHLVYVICHIAKHFNSFGAGVRMFMDLDVLSRQLSKEKLSSALNICKTLGLETFSNACLSLCKNWFNTPIEINYDINSNDSLKNVFENEVINAGTFGKINKTLSDFYLIDGSSRSADKKHFKLNGIISFLFPHINYMRLRYNFVNKCSLFLPVAWLVRFFEGLFKRRKHSKETLSSIINTNNTTDEYIKLLKELEI